MRSTIASQQVEASVHDPATSRRVTLLTVLLFVCILILYLPIAHNSFINFDDDTYIVSNVQIHSGVNWQTVKWSLTTTYEGNWGPLSWLSHALDWEWFGMRAGGHHLVSACLHAMNIAILFWSLWNATGAIWRSLVVAALVGVHPVNVESVAWAAERKNVLSMLFFLLALLAYGWYVRQPQWRRYCVVAFAYLLALMSKPQVITFPFLLMLWDYWPLGRYCLKPGQETGRGEEWQREFSVWKAAREKVPFLLMSAGSAVVTVIAERSAHAVRTSAEFSVTNRLETAVTSYVRYLRMAIWPSDLAVIYPHPMTLFASWQVAGACAVLLLGSAIAVWQWRRRPHLAVGWFWFLGAMFPMIGIVQVGTHALADRFAYIPFIGLFVIGVWLIAEGAGRMGLSRVTQVAIASGALIGYAVAARMEMTYWRDSYRLFSRAIEVTEANPIAEENLGAALMEMQRPDLAEPHLRRAIELVPTLSVAHYDLATLLHRGNHLEEAFEQYQLALNYGLDERAAAQAHNNLGVLLNQRGRRDDAREEFSRALALNPYEQNSLIGRGLIEHETGLADAALQDFVRAAQVGPSPLALYWQGRVFEEKGLFPAAAEAYQSALQLSPDFGDAQERLRKTEEVMHAAK